MSEFMFPFLWAPQFYHDDCEVRGYHEAESDFQTFFFPYNRCRIPSNLSAGGCRCGNNSPGHWTFSVFGFIWWVLIWNNAFYKLTETLRLVLHGEFWYEIMHFISLLKLFLHPLTETWKKQGVKKNKNLHFKDSVLVQCQDLKVPCGVFLQSFSFHSEISLKTQFESSRANWHENALTSSLNHLNTDSFF